MPGFRKRLTNASSAVSNSPASSGSPTLSFRNIHQYQNGNRISLGIFVTAAHHLRRIDLTFSCHGFCKNRQPREKPLSTSDFCAWLMPAFQKFAQSTRAVFADER